MYLRLRNLDAVDAISRMVGKDHVCVVRKISAPRQFKRNFENFVEIYPIETTTLWSLASSTITSTLTSMVKTDGTTTFPAHLTQYLTGKWEYVDKFADECCLSKKQPLGQISKCTYFEF